MMKTLQILGLEHQSRALHDHFQPTASSPGFSALLDSHHIPQNSFTLPKNIKIAKLYRGELRDASGGPRRRRSYGADESDEADNGDLRDDQLLDFEDQGARKASIEERILRGDYDNILREDDYWNLMERKQRRERTGKQ